MRILLSLMGLCILSVAPSFAQQELKLQFTVGQTIQYKVFQSTKAVDTLGEEKVQLSSTVELMKRWTVSAVDPDGVATMQMSIMQLKMKQQLPSGQVWEFDSTNLQASHEKLREQLAKFIGQPTVELRVATDGRVLAAKPLLGVPVNQYETDPPFLVHLHAQAVSRGQTWSRQYKITLDPPLGTGEKFDSEQTYQIQELVPGRAVIRYSTKVKMPMAAIDALPLLQKTPQGEVHLDTQKGLMIYARVLTGGTLEGHRGDKSKYEYSSEYVESLQM